MKHHLDGVRPLPIDARNKVELEGCNVISGRSVDDLETVKEHPEEPRYDVKVDDVQRSLWIRVVDLGDDAALLVTVAHQVTGCVKSRGLQNSKDLKENRSHSILSKS